MGAQNWPLLHILVHPPLGSALICLILIPFVWVAVYLIGPENTLFFYGGLVATVILLIRPVVLGTFLFLLWKNPGKYKEYEMKKRRKMRELDSEEK